MDGVTTRRVLITAVVVPLLAAACGRTGPERAVRGATTTQAPAPDTAPEGSTTSTTSRASDSSPQVADSSVATTTVNGATSAKKTKSVPTTAKVKALPSAGGIAQLSSSPSSGPQPSADQPRPG